MKHILEVDSVTLNFGQRRVLSDVYLKCETGKVTGILGRNGSGKTCLMNIICGSLKGENQSVRINNIHRENLYKHQGIIYYLPQFSIIPKSLRICQIFNDFSISFEEMTHHFPEFINKQNDRIKSLSGGQLRLLEVYVALYTQAKFIILDEPFSHIMPLHIETLIKIITEQKQQKGILISDHLYIPVVTVSDDLYVLHDTIISLTKTKKDLVKYGYIKDI